MHAGITDKMHGIGDWRKRSIIYGKVGGEVRCKVFTGSESSPENGSLETAGRMQAVCRPTIPDRQDNNKIPCYFREKNTNS